MLVHLRRVRDADENTFADMLDMCCLVSYYVGMDALQTTTDPQPAVAALLTELDQCEIALRNSIAARKATKERLDDLRSTLSRALDARDEAYDAYNAAREALFVAEAEYGATDEANS